MLGLVAVISLSGLHSFVISVRFGVVMGGRMNLRSLDCEKFMHELYVARVGVLCWFCKNVWSINMLWSKVILS